MPCGQERAIRRAQLPRGARERLDAILDELERDAVDVDQLAERVQEASDLIRLCRERLSATRRDVERVVAELASEEASDEDQAAS